MDTYQPPECDLQKYKTWQRDNGDNLQIYTQDCWQSLVDLKVNKAGGFGPIDEKAIHDRMCKWCLDADILRMEAMEFSACDCAELSTPQPYHIKWDFCQFNSARMLCKLHERCGKWECRLDDFMCPRYEWNREFPICGSATRGSQPNFLLTLVATTVTAALMQVLFR